MVVEYIGGESLSILEVGDWFDVLNSEEGLVQISAGWFHMKNFIEVEKLTRVKRPKNLTIIVEG